MKRILSLLLVATMLLTLFTACSKKDIPVETEPPVIPTETIPEITEPENTDITIKGLLYRTESGQVVLLSENAGAIVLTNEMEFFAHVSDFAVVQITTEVITTESNTTAEPSRATAKTCEVVSQQVDQELMTSVGEIFDKMVGAGYEPSSIGTIVDREDVYVYTTPFDLVATAMDKLSENKDNTMFSPLSLNIALGMLANGATDEVRTNFDNYFGMPLDNFNKYIKYYTENSTPKFGDTVVDIANSIWVQDYLNLKDAYVNTLMDAYKAEVNKRPFDASIVKEVDDWVSEKTHSMIPKILEETPANDVLLINALYFQGDWEVEYFDFQVYEEEFTTASGDVVSVEGLHASDYAFYMENDKATAFAKYYKDMRYAFVGILPKEEGDFNLSDLALDSLMDVDTMEMLPVTSMIPKFKFNNSHKLTEVMETLGLGVSTMTFSEITDNEALNVTNILQKTAIEVTEKGTRAAAVTSITTNGMIVAPDQTGGKEIILNRPFAFMIYDMENQTILFIGKVTNPTL